MPHCLSNQFSISLLDHDLVELYLDINCDLKYGSQTFVPFHTTLVWKVGRLEVGLPHEVIQLIRPILRAFSKTVVSLCQTLRHNI